MLAALCLPAALQVHRLPNTWHVAAHELSAELTSDGWFAGAPRRQGAQRNTEDDRLHQPAAGLRIDVRSSEMGLKMRRQPAVGRSWM